MLSVPADPIGAAEWRFPDPVLQALIKHGVGCWTLEKTGRELTIRLPDVVCEDTGLDVACLHQPPHEIIHAVYRLITRCKYLSYRKYYKWQDTRDETSCKMR